MRQLIYPVGSIYISVTDDTVAKVEARYGGTWERFGTGKTLVGVDTSDTDFDTIEESAGVKTIDLSHSHTVNSHSHDAGSLNAGINLFVTGGRLYVDYNQRGGSKYSENYRAYVGSSTLSNSSHNETNTTGAGVVGSTGNASPGTDSKLSASQSILQPYITVYMYKRTA